VERHLTVTGYRCAICHATDVVRTHRCDKGLEQSLVLAEYVASRWFWQEPFNPDSPDQILTYMKARGHKPGRGKKTGADSTDRDTLKRLAKETKDPLYQAILDSRAVGKVRGTYGEGTRKLMDAEDRVHPVPTFRPSTMRLSYTSPNITNVVADKGGKDGLATGFRKCIVSGTDLPKWVTSEGLQAWEDRWCHESR
jgi:DNA polymerase I-like protein with 3'-5' exonuclease and polymerase domains